MLSQKRPQQRKPSAPNGVLQKHHYRQAADWWILIHLKFRLRECYGNALENRRRGFANRYDHARCDRRYSY